MKTFRLIIAGPRTFSNYEFVKEQAYYLTRNVDIDDIEIVSGGCSDEENGVLTFVREDGSKVYGVDGLGERLAQEKGWTVTVFMADWKKHGRAAGPIRNDKMGQYATHALILWDGNSRGSANMIKVATKYSLCGSTVNY